MCVIFIVLQILRVGFGEEARQSQTSLVSIETQTIKVRESQKAKTKGEIQAEMEDRRQRVKEKQVSPIYPWNHMCRAAREAEE